MNNKKMREDKLMQIDFNDAFPDTPFCIHEAVHRAKAEIRYYEQRNSLRRRVFSVAAAAVIMIAGLSAALLIYPGRNNDDLITPPVLAGNESLGIDPETAVFTSKTDPYYHRSIECSLAVDSVELPFITAVEFDKIPCPDCCIEAE